MFEQYDKITDWYDKNRRKDLIEKEYLELVLQHIPENGTILDLGCGTGEPIAQFFIARGFHVKGIDAAKNMINLCKKRFPTMEWIVEDMRKVSLDKKFDALIAWDSFFHLNPEDQKHMFSAFEKHIKPTGVLVFTSGPEEGEVYGTMEEYDFYHASLSSQEYRELLNQHNFSVILHKVVDPKCGDHTVWVAQVRT